jgi:hypothetical protein
VKPGSASTIRPDVVVSRADREGNLRCDVVRIEADHGRHEARFLAADRQGLEPIGQKPSLRLKGIRRRLSQKDKPLAQPVKQLWSAGL